MAIITPIQVDVQFDDVASKIARLRAVAVKAQSDLAMVSTELGKIPDDYANLIQTVNGYAPTGAVETLAKNKLSIFTTEYQGLKAKTDAANDVATGLGQYDFSNGP